MKKAEEIEVESTEQDEQLLDDNQLVCILTGEVKKDSFANIGPPRFKRI